MSPPLLLASHHLMDDILVRDDASLIDVSERLKSQLVPPLLVIQAVGHRLTNDPASPPSGPLRGLVQSQSDFGR